MKVIIFDFDGLMVDTEMLCFKSHVEFLKRFGISFTMEQYLKKYPGNSLIDIHKMFREDFGLTYELEDSLPMYQEIEDRYLDAGVNLKSGLIELLEYLKENKYKIALATSSVPARAIKILEAHKIVTYFDAMAFAKDVANGKPHPDIFLKACQDVGVKPEQGLVLEDSETGIEAAYRASVPVICIPDIKEPSASYKNKTLHTFDSLYDVIEFLKRQ